MNAMIRNYKVRRVVYTRGLLLTIIQKWMPNHRPIWTLVGVAALGLPQMKVEIEVIAVLDD